MATRKETAAFLLDQFSEAGTVTAKRMFGEYGLYLDDRIFALVCDDRLFLKPTEAGRALLGEPEEAPPYPGAKPCFLIPEEDWDDRERLAALARTTAAALPPPAKKRGKPKA